MPSAQSSQSLLIPSTPFPYMYIFSHSFPLQLGYLHQVYGLDYLSDIEDADHGMLTGGDDLSSPYWSGPLHWHVILAYQAGLHQ